MRSAKKKWLVKCPCLLVLLVCIQGCGVYSFTGASIPDHMSTISVPLVELRAAGSVPDLDQTLTQALIERFVDRTRLTLEPTEGVADAVLTTSIDRYSLTPVAVTGDERASLNRVTIAVSVRYFDRVEDSERLSRNFTASADYDPAEGPAGESEAAQRAIDQLAGDIFTAATSDW